MNQRTQGRSHQNSWITGLNGARCSLVMSLAACASLIGATAVPAGHELDGRDLVNGAAVYADNCAACHGAELEGAPNWQVADENGILPAPPHDETGHTWHHSNQQNFDYTKLGGAEIVKRLGISSFQSGMPGFGDALSDDDIWDVLAFIRASWPQEIRDLHDTRNPPHP